MTSPNIVTLVANAVAAGTSTLAASSPTGAALAAGAGYLFFRFRRLLTRPPPSPRRA